MIVGLSAGIADVGVVVGIGCAIATFGSLDETLPSDSWDKTFAASTIAAVVEVDGASVGISDVGAFAIAVLNSLAETNRNNNYY